MWEATRVLGENPRRHGKNVQTPYRQWPWLRIVFFFLVSVIMMLNGNDIIRGPAIPYRVFALALFCILLI